MKKISVMTVLAVALLLSACAGPVVAVPEQSISTQSTTATTLPTSSPSPAVGPITRERAIEIASKHLRPSLLARAKVSAELRGWYWEVVFDDLNATSDEMLPYPLGEFHPPPPVNGERNFDPWAGKTWQTIIVRVDAQSGLPSGLSLREKVAETSSPMSESEAIETARRQVAIFQKGVPGEDFSWLDKASVDASLLDNIWTVVFYEEGNSSHRLRVSFNATTGENVAVARG